MDVLGTRCRLEVTRVTLQGAYLDGGPRGEILLPGRYLPNRTANQGDPFTVFVHRDSDDRLVATPETPLVEVGGIAALKVVSVTPRMGAFLAWGIGKDLLLPMRQQRNPVRVGDTVVAAVYVDETSDRIIASTKLEKMIPEGDALHANQEVSLLVAWETPIGYTAVINRNRLGLLYKSDLPGRLKIGETLPGFVKTVRPDGKVDLTLNASGYKRVEPLGEKILYAMSDAGGRLPYSDRSAPEELFRVFGCSKKAFKQAIGSLYRGHRILLLENGIQLTAPVPRRPEK